MLIDSLVPSAPVVLAALAIMAASFIGVVAASRSLDHWLCRHIALLVSFSAGVFSVVAIDLVREAAHELSLGPLLLSAAAGFALLWLAGLLLPESHHHHDPESPDEATHSHGKRILLADAIHNVGDGVVLVAGFAASTTLGIGVAVSIFVHEAVQELSEYFVLRHSGYRPARALLLNGGVSATLFIGVALGLLLTTMEHLEALLLAGAAGAFLYVVAKDLLPESLRAAHNQPRRVFVHGLALLAGIALMLLVNTLAPHLSV